MASTGFMSIRIPPPVSDATVYGQAGGDMPRFPSALRGIEKCPPSYAGKNEAPAYREDML